MEALRGQGDEREVESVGRGASWHAYCGGQSCTHEGKFAAKRGRDRRDDSLSNGTVSSGILGYDHPDYRSRHEQAASWSSAIGDDDGDEHQDIDHTVYRKEDAGVAVWQVGTDSNSHPWRWCMSVPLSIEYRWWPLTETHSVTNVVHLCIRNRPSLWLSSAILSREAHVRPERAWSQKAVKEALCIGLAVSGSCRAGMTAVPLSVLLGRGRRPCHPALGNPCCMNWSKSVQGRADIACSRMSTVSGRKRSSAVCKWYRPQTCDWRKSPTWQQDVGTVGRNVPIF